jgi:DNA-binding GntR family transcriptional regulator
LAATPNPRVSDRLEELSQTLGRKEPITDQIANVIRKLIIAGDLNPGERIIESRVAKQLGVGQPTVREALVTLEYQGLVVRKANQGCLVTSLTREEIAHILRIRAELEILAVDLAVENAADADIHKLLAITGHMKAAAHGRDIEDFFSHDQQFHEALWKLSGNTILPRLLSQLMLPLLAFLFLRNLRNNAPIDLFISAEAHVDIAEAILTRDKAHARQVAQEKLQMFAEQHLSSFSE